MDQYLLIPFLGEWTSIYQLFWCSPGVRGFDTLTYIYIYMGPFPVIHGYYQHGCVVFGFGGSLFSDKAKIDLINYTHLNSQ